MIDDSAACSSKIDVSSAAIYRESQRRRHHGLLQLFISENQGSINLRSTTEDDNDDDEKSETREISLQTL